MIVEGKGQDRGEGEDIKGPGESFTAGEVGLGVYSKEKGEKGDGVEGGKMATLFGDRAH